MTQDKGKTLCELLQEASFNKQKWRRECLHPGAVVGKAGTNKPEAQFKGTAEVSTKRNLWT